MNEQPVLVVFIELFLRSNFNNIVVIEGNFEIESLTVIFAGI